jgi:hypothetical protein
MIPSFEMKCLPCGLCKLDKDSMTGSCPKHCEAHKNDVKKVLAQVQSGTLSKTSPEYMAVMRLKQQSLRWENMLVREKRKEEKEMGMMYMVTIIALAVSGVALVGLCAYRSKMKSMIDNAVNSIVEENEKRRMRQESEHVELSGLTNKEDEEDYNVSSTKSRC